MQIWIDADACPKVIKEMCFRAADRARILVVLVANQPINIPLSPFIKTIQVSAGFDVADQKIIENVQSGDLVITADIPLADAVITKGAIALNPRGDFYTKNNIKQCLTLRNLSAELRDSGLISGGPAKLSKKEIHIFATHLDRILTKR